MSKRAIACTLLVVFLVVGCADISLHYQYTSKASEISDKYGSDDATISLGNLTQPNPNLVIRSKKFSELSDEQKYLYLYELNQIVADSDLRISVAVISGDVYQLSPDSDRAFSDSGSGMVFPYGTPTGMPDDKIVFDPPIKVELILTDNQPFVLAADTISYLVDYGRYSVMYNNSPELRKIYDQGYAYYLTEDTHVLLLEIDGIFAKIQLIEPHWDKKVGDIGWLHEENIKSYPKQ